MKPTEIKIIIEMSEDTYCAYSEGEEFITGVGDTLEECKRSAYECVDIQIELGNLAKGAYKLVFKYDIESFLEHYKGIFTNSALERLTGINQSQISHYATGLKKPRPAQRKKIEKALHKLGEELLTVELI